MDREFITHLMKRAGCQDPPHIRTLPGDDTWVLIPVKDIYNVIQSFLSEIPDWHLTAITGQDTGECIELMYHFWFEEGVTFCIRLPYEDPTIRSITPLIPGAAFYEREVIEMLGVRDPELKEEKLLLLPDLWSKGWPLRIDKTGEGNE